MAHFTKKIARTLKSANENFNIGDRVLVEKSGTGTVECLWSNFGLVVKFDDRDRNMIINCHQEKCIIIN